jgi:hypothetical protein
MSRYTIPVMVVSMKKGPYTVMCIKLAVFCYIMTVQNVEYVVCINLYTLSKLKSSFETPYIMVPGVNSRVIIRPGSEAGPI